MLSADKAPNSDIGVREQEAIIYDFAGKIDSCIEHADWEALSLVLEARQKYLEQIFDKSSLDKATKEELKRIARLILEQDKSFLNRIQLLKDSAAQQQLSIERGRRAINAYNAN